MTLAEHPIGDVQDAAAGPLTQSLAGVILENDESEKPYKVRLRVLMCKVLVWGFLLVLCYARRRRRRRSISISIISSYVLLLL